MTDACVFVGILLHFLHTFTKESIKSNPLGGT
jgi:hypothetical protein